jgi:hypothetical protein
VILDDSTIKIISTVVVPSISALTALAAVVLGVYLQSKIAKRQAELQFAIAKKQAELQSEIAKRQAADNISAKRQNWIDELRKDTAEYLTVISRVEGLRRPNPDSSEEEQKQTFEDRYIANARGMELGIRIQLRLNPTEPGHNQLVQLFTSLGALCGASPGETPQQERAALRLFSQERAKIISHVQTILKREWERIKQGD